MSYLKNQELRYRNKKPISVKCDECERVFTMLYSSAEKNRKKNGKHICCSCSGYPIKPQQTQGYWDKDRRESHGNSVKNSEKYKQAISDRDTSGEKNGMFGKVHSKKTKAKMSKSRIGKIGPKATAWKGGKTSLNCRVKGFIHKRYKWYYRVYQKDNWRCTKCGLKGKIDAHHIDPISKIIKRITLNKVFKDDSEKFMFVVSHPDIIDIDLKNGITLCRSCHKEAHNRWGSHNAKTN